MADNNGRRYFPVFRRGDKVADTKSAKSGGREDPAQAQAQAQAAPPAETAVPTANVRCVSGSPSIGVETSSSAAVTASPPAPPQRSQLHPPHLSPTPPSPGLVALPGMWAPSPRPVHRCALKKKSDRCRTPGRQGVSLVGRNPRSCESSCRRCGPIAIFATSTSPSPIPCFASR